MGNEKGKSPTFLAVTKMALVDFEMTPDQRSIFEDSRHAEAVSKCSELPLGGNLHSEQWRKALAKAGFYANMADALRECNPAQYRDAFMKDPRKYVKENWEGLFESSWKNQQESSRHIRP
jgi:hypothetical protein